MTVSHIIVEAFLPTHLCNIVSVTWDLRADLYLLLSKGPAIAFQLVWDLTVPLLHLFCFCCCCGFAVVFRIIVLLDYPVLTKLKRSDRLPHYYYKEEFVVNSLTARCPDSVITNHQPCIAVFYSWYEVFVWICSVWLKPDMALCITARHLHFGLVCPRTLFQECCGLFRSNFANFSCAAMFSL